MNVGTGKFFVNMSMMDFSVLGMKDTDTALSSNAFVYVMIVNVNVFGSPFLDRVRSDEDWSHVVTTNGDSPKGET